jgi:hypothetical protein
VNATILFPDLGDTQLSGVQSFCSWERLLASGVRTTNEGTERLLTLLPNERVTAVIVTRDGITFCLEIAP